MKDEIAYALVLVFSVAGGFLISSINFPFLRKLCCGLTGFFSILYLCGTDFIYALFSIIGCVVLCHVNVFKNQRRFLSFCWAFFMLTVFRVVHLFGIPAPSPLANAIQLVLTLKMVGLGGEIFESENSEISMPEKERMLSQPIEQMMYNSETKSVLLSIYRDVFPSVIDSFCYLYSYVGIFTGPYYSYRAWNDAMEGTITKSTFLCSFKIFRQKKIQILLSQTALCGVLYFALVIFFPSDYLWTVNWSKSSYLLRLFYLVPVFSWFRLRFYAAWLAAEAACTALGIGVYPNISNPEPGAGPTNLVALHQVLHLKTNYEIRSAKEEPKCRCSTSPECSFWSTNTVHNVGIESCEFSPTVSGKLRNWNKSVQYWLAVNVYQRLPRTCPRPVRAFITVIVSAYWHGLHAGYYLSLGTAGILLSAERIVPKLKRIFEAYFAVRQSPPQTPEKEKTNDLAGKLIFYLSKYLSGFWSMRAFEYMAVGFYALSFSDTTRIWSDVLYIHHVVALVLVIVSYVLPLSFGDTPDHKNE